MGKTYVIVILSIFLLSCVNVSGSSTQTQTIKNSDLIKTNTEKYHLNITVKSLYMLDDIDPLINTKAADWYWRISINDGTTVYYRDTWEHWCPRDKEKLENYNMKHEWTFNLQHSISIQVELRDNDDPFGTTDDTCDVNGAVSEYDLRIARITYYPETKTFNLKDSGGTVDGNIVKLDGSLDEQGSDVDEDDAIMFLEITDDYVPEEKFPNLLCGKIVLVQYLTGITFYVNIAQSSYIPERPMISSDDLFDIAFYFNQESEPYTTVENVHFSGDNMILETKIFEQKFKDFVFPKGPFTIRICLDSNNDIQEDIEIDNNGTTDFIKSKTINKLNPLFERFFHNDVNILSNFLCF